MATIQRIDKIVASKFRGASRTTSLSIDASKPFVLLFGENGTGKSTMIDAIDMVCNQNAGTLQNRSSVSISKHLPTIGSKAADLFAEISADGKTWRAKLKGTRITVTPDGTTPSAAILRRHKVLKLVEATPSERFGELKRFIDVDGVQQGENALPKAIKEASARIDARTAELEAAKENLRKAFEEQKTKEEERLTSQEWAKNRIEIDFKAQQDTLRELKAVLDLHAAALTLTEAKNASQDDLDKKREALDAITKKIASAGTLDTKTGIVLVELLTQAGEYLGREPTKDECPVCLRPAVSADLAKDINERLGKMTGLKALADEWAKANSGVATATETTRKSYTTLVGKVQALATKVRDLDSKHRGDWAFDAPRYSNLLGWSQKLTKEDIAENDTFMADVESLVTVLQQQYETLNEQVVQLNAIKRDYDTCLRAEREATREFAVRAMLENMLKIVRRERIAFTQVILDDIADTCDAMYAKIHPGEALGGVRFALDQEKKGSLLQAGHFEGHKEVAPQAYFSDSHLDTLAFCFFVAITKQTQGHDATLVIDDVFTSVDMNHIKRILMLLLDEAENFRQVILATHQRRWLDLFLTQQAPANKACIIQLREWSLATGICGDDVKPYLDDLQTSLASPKLNRREVGSLSGFLIESVLGEMTKHLNCSIKRNPRDKYTASDLLCSMTTAAKKIKVQASPAEGVDPLLISDGPPSLQQLVSDLKETLTDVRNTVGDHFNWDAADIPNETVRKFGTDVEAMCRILMCEACGGMATRDKRTYLTCACTLLRIERG